MSTPIERLKFFDGEYLRSSDFTDEQAYHVEMRRRLNHRLHLHGIVYGLQIVLDQISVPPNAMFFSIAPGMAIDRSGREIFVPAPYSLTSGGVLNQPGLKAGEWEVWLCYQETAAGGPASGNQNCSTANQSTRWQESYQVVLVSKTGNSVVSASGGVRIGIISLTASSNGWQISVNTDRVLQNMYRTYVGIRTQRVVAADEEPDTFDMSKQNINPANPVPLPGYVDFEPGLLARGNVIVQKNLVIGDDFPLADPPNNTPDPNLPSPIPDTGNLKITNDLFLQGDFYGFLSGSGKWYKLKDYIQSLMPGFVTGTASIAIPNTITPPLTSSAIITVPPQLPNVDPGKTQLMLSIIDIQWQSEDEIKNFGTGNIECGVTGVVTGSISPFTLTITCNVNPITSTTGIGTVHSPFTNVIVQYMVIFYPPSS